MSGEAWHSMRASDADRERATDVIKAAVAEGRLSWDEHEERLQQVMRARTYGELQRLVADLPTGVLPTSSSLPAVQAPRGTPSRLPLQRKINDLATASIICGGLGFVTGITAIPAVITGHMALTKIKQTGEDGRGLAIAGLLMGYIVMVGFVLMVLMIIGLAWTIGTGPAGP